MIREGQPITIRVEADDSLVGSDKAVSMELIVTELVINAIKYAFPVNRSDAAIVVAFQGGGEGWSLSVSDNGVGPLAGASSAGGGLGTAIVEALVKQLGARIETPSGPGMTVAVSRPRA